MSLGIAAERKLLAEDEYGPVAETHYPALKDATRERLIELAQWLRARRNRARDIISGHRRVRLGKAGERGQQTPSERGLAAKKQVFSHALRRVNGRIEVLAAEQRVAVKGLREALARKRITRARHPGAGATASGGMQDKASTRRRTRVNPGKVGSVSQQGRNAQARRDA